MLYDQCVLGCIVGLLYRGSLPKIVGRCSKIYWHLLVKLVVLILQNYQWLLFQKENVVFCKYWITKTWAWLNLSHILPTILCKCSWRKQIVDITYFVIARLRAVLRYQVMKRLYFLSFIIWQFSLLISYNWTKKVMLKILFGDLVTIWSTSESVTSSFICNLVNKVNIYWRLLVIISCDILRFYVRFGKFSTILFTPVLKTLNHS